MKLLTQALAPKDPGWIVLSSPSQEPQDIVNKRVDGMQKLTYDLAFIPGSLGRRTQKPLNLFLAIIAIKTLD